MKHLLSLLSALFIANCATTFGQTTEIRNNLSSQFPLIVTNSTSDRQHPELGWGQEMRDRYAFVKEYIRYPDGSEIGAHFLKSMGDEVALHLSAMINTMPPLTTAQTHRVLHMIHVAFSEPKSVRNAADLKPNGVLNIIAFIQAKATDLGVKSRIATELAFLKTVPSSVTPPPFPGGGIPGMQPNMDDFNKK